MSLVIETVRPGVQFVPDAADAFRRAEAQVREEFNRDIDVNSTYRDWDTQMSMHMASLAYINGKGPYPGHSFAAHPSNSRHVSGIALDSDDWVIDRIVAILAENGFIRNQLHVPNEQHHFEWIKARDNNYGKPIPASTSNEPFNMSEDDDMPIVIMQRADSRKTKMVYNFLSGKCTRRLTRDENNLLRSQPNNPNILYLTVSDSEYRARGGLD